MTYRKTLAMAAAALTAGGLTVIAQPAAAKGRPIVVTAAEDELVRYVHYADLDLASSQGESLLNRRVGRAINSLCAEATEGLDRSLQLSIAKGRCPSGAWDGARPQMALAVQRAHDIAMTGSSNIAATAIVISLPQ
jgi:UrcA family protein